MDADLSAQVFDSFDKDKNNEMDCSEYLCLMGVTLCALLRLVMTLLTNNKLSSGGTMEQKLRSSFEIFDKDGNGSLSKDEVRQMLTMVVKQVTRAQMKAKSKKVTGDTPIEIDDQGKKKIEEILDQIFDKVDVDKVRVAWWLPLVPLV